MFYVHLKDCLGCINVSNPLVRYSGLGFQAMSLYYNFKPHFTTKMSKHLCISWWEKRERCFQKNQRCFEKRTGFRPWETPLQTLLKSPSLIYRHGHTFHSDVGCWPYPSSQRIWGSEPSSLFSFAHNSSWTVTNPTLNACQSKQKASWARGELQGIMLYLCTRACTCISDRVRVKWTPWMSVCSQKCIVTWSVNKTSEPIVSTFNSSAFTEACASF